MLTLIGLLFHWHIRLYKKELGRKIILITDNYWSCVSLCGGANGIIYFVKLGDQIRQLPCFCVNILGRGRHHPLMLPEELYASSKKVSMMTLGRKKESVKVT